MEVRTLTTSDSGRMRVFVTLEPHEIDALMAGDPVIFEVPREGQTALRVELVSQAGRPGDGPVDFRLRLGYAAVGLNALRVGGKVTPVFGDHVPFSVTLEPAEVPATAHVQLAPGLTYTRVDLPGRSDAKPRGPTPPARLDWSLVFWSSVLIALGIVVAALEPRHRDVAAFLSISGAALLLWHLRHRLRR
jgi:hypothetical protein